MSKSLLRSGSWSVVALFFLGVCAFLPFVFSAVLLAIALTLMQASLPFTGMLVLAGVCALAGLFSASFWHALLLQAGSLSSQKSFRLVDCFVGARKLFVRTTGLLFLSLSWLVVLAGIVLVVQNVLVEVVIGLLLLFTPFIFLRSPTLLSSHSVFASLRLSAQKVFSRSRLRQWVFVKLASFVVLLVLVLGSYSELVAQEMHTVLRVLFSFVVLMWFGVLSPFFSFLVVLGGNGFIHVAVLYVLGVLLQLVYVDVLYRKAR